MRLEKVEFSLGKEHNLEQKSKEKVLAKQLSHYNICIALGLRFFLHSMSEFYYSPIFIIPKCLILIFVVVQSLSRVRLFSTPCTAAHQAPQSFTISQHLLKLMSVELMMPSNHLIVCHPFSFLQSFPALGCFLKSPLFVSGGRSTGASKPLTE